MCKARKHIPPFIYFSLIVAIGLASIFCCCWTTTEAEAQEAVPSCHSTAEQVPVEVQECECEESAAVLKSAVTFDDLAFNHFVFIEEGPRLDVAPNPFIPQVVSTFHQQFDDIPLYLKHSILRI